MHANQTVIQLNYLLVCNPNEWNIDSYNTIMTTTAMNDITVYMYILYQTYWPNLEHLYTIN
jgi:hypothetical protein